MQIVYSLTDMLPDSLEMGNEIQVPVRHKRTGLFISVGG